MAINRTTTFNLAAPKNAALDSGFYLLPFTTIKPAVYTLIHSMPAATKSSSFVLMESILVEQTSLRVSFSDIASNMSAILYKVKNKPAAFVIQTPDITISEISTAISFSEVTSSAQPILYKVKNKPAAFNIAPAAISLAGTEVEVSPKALVSGTQIILHKLLQKPAEFVVIPEDKEIVDLEINAELLLRKMKFTPMLHYGASHSTQELTEGFSTLYFMGIDGLSQPSVATWYPILLGERETYSYERYLTLDCVYKGVSEEAYDFKMWAELTAPEEISLYYGFNLQYVAPKNSKSLVATIEMPESFEDAVLIPINSINERMQQIGDKTMYIVLQVAVKPTATGSLRGDLHIAWKEIM